jgi:hypothetical protein
MYTSSISSWNCQKLVADKSLQGQAIRTFHHSTELQQPGNSFPAKLGGRRAGSVLYGLRTLWVKEMDILSREELKDDWISDRFGSCMTYKRAKGKDAEKITF